MKINYLFILIFLGKLWFSVNSTLVDSEGVNKYSVKYEVKNNDDDSEGEKNETVTFVSSSSGKKEDVLDKQGNLTGSIYNKDSKGEVESENNKEESTVVEDKNDENKTNDDETNQEKELEDENNEFKDINLQSDDDTQDQDKKQKESNVSISKIGSLSIDIIKDFDTDLCVVKKLDLNNIPTQLYIPRAGYRITKLTDEDETIWESNEDEYSFMVDTTICNDNKPCMILVATKTGSDEDCKYFEKNGIKWEEVSSGWYYFKLISKVKLTINDNVYDLDINQKEHESYTFIDCDMDYIHTYFYLNKPGHKINIVKDGNHVLYTSNKLLESYINVRVTISEGKPILIKIEGILTKLTKTLKYEMVNNRWELIDDERYTEVIKKVRNDRKRSMN